MCDANIKELEDLDIEISFHENSLQHWMEETHFKVLWLLKTAQEILHFI